MVATMVRFPDPIKFMDRISKIAFLAKELMAVLGKLYLPLARTNKYIVV